MVGHIGGAAQLVDAPLLRRHSAFGEQDSLRRKEAQAIFFRGSLRNALAIVLGPAVHERVETSSPNEWCTACVEIAVVLRCTLSCRNNGKIGKRVRSPVG